MLPHNVHIKLLSCRIGGRSPGYISTQKRCQPSYGSRTSNFGYRMWVCHNGLQQNAKPLE